MSQQKDKRIRAHIIEMNTDARIRNGYLAAFILLLISYLLTFYTTRQLKLQMERVMHTNAVITQIEILVSDVKDAEVGFRGYLDVKENKFLEPFYSSQYRVIESLKKLGTLVADNPIQVNRRDTLQALVAEKFININKLTKEFRAYGYIVPDSLKQNTIKGKQVMDEIRGLTQRMKTTENILLASRTRDLNAFGNAIGVINIASLVLAFLLALYAILTFNRDVKAKNIYRINLENKIADLKASNKELTELRRFEKFAVTGRIARTIAHEVRNPLTNIVLAAEQLKEGSNQTEESDLYYNMIERNSNRVNQLVTELLQATKFTDLKPSRESINALVDEALLQARDRIELQGLEVEKKYADKICDVSVDKERITIAFLNIILNAIEAMDPGKGKLVVETKSENNKCMISISDNGRGMDKETISKLFEPYFTSKPKGNGLGLTNTQNIILNHKGNIYVDSMPGKGTVFTIVLDFAS